MSGCGCDSNQTAKLQRTTLWSLLIINLAMFFVEIVAGWWGESSGLLADSLDMLADALVYGIALYAVGRAVKVQINAATASGLLQVALGAGVLLDVGRRLVWGSEPMSSLMMLVGVCALVANLCCLMLIARHREGGIHMRASWIFSVNDVVANFGVILSGALVFFLDSRLPDLLIGALVSLVVIRGGVRILADVRETRQPKPVV